jgi:DNA/RNA-binding domain of Phe-tRNA-synthetase-like protein
MTPSPEIRIDPGFAEAGVEVALGCVTARVAVRADDPASAAALARLAETLAPGLGQGPVGELPVVARSRAAFRALGKDPSRYRPSCEALLRRVAQAKPLFAVNSLVDANNLVSLETQLPAGCYDLAVLKGRLALRVGRPGESYEAIGRGPFNLENLPLLCDAEGPFGSPTSDSVRTMITPAAETALLVLYAFGGSDGLEAALDAAETALKTCCAADIETREIVRP